MTATPLWFGPDGRELFAWLHIPEGGSARGAVVLCPPVGYEYAATHRTFRTLAERLEEQGIASLRLDYDGTGDSAGRDTDTGRVAAWTASIDAAIDALRAAGAPAVGVAGMRLGALLASECASRRADLDALVLWDPVWSGKAYVRQARTLHLLATDAPAAVQRDDGGMWVTGTLFTGETVDDLQARKLADLSGSTARTLVLRRPDQTAVGARHDGLPPGAEEAEAADQDRLLDCASSAAIPPLATVDGIAAWLGDAFLAEARPIAVFGTDHSSTEEVVRIPPLGLFGIRSTSGTGPTVVFLNGGTDHHIGPNRIWVDWGRELAAQGFRVARVDLSGIGDSPARDGQPLDRSYPGDAIEDVRAIAEHFGQVVLVGLCSGARHSVAAAAAGVGGIVGVCAFSPALHLPEHALRQISNVDPYPAIVDGLENNRLRNRAVRLLPKPAWRAIHGVARGRSRLSLPAAAVAGGTPLFLSYGTGEWFLQKLRETSAWHIDELRGDERFTFVEVPGLDHPLMAPNPRHELLGHAAAWLRSVVGAARHDMERMDVPDVVTRT